MRVPALLSAERVVVERVPLCLPRLHPAFDGLTIVQISDIHVDRWMTGDRLAGLIERVNALQADVAVLTGDFVWYAARGVMGELARGLSGLHAPVAKLAVLGNHDHRNSRAGVCGALERAGITLIDNDVFTLRRGDAELHFPGVDSVTRGEPALHETLDRVPAGAGGVLLMHEPDVADAVALTGRVDLQLSGHTHGGQLCPPVLGPLYLPARGRKYLQGIYAVGAMRLYVNRGLGATLLHMRLRCPAEITLFTLHSPRAEPAAGLPSEQS